MRMTWSPVTGLLQYPCISRKPQCHLGKSMSQSLLSTWRKHRHELVEQLGQGHPVSPSWETGSKDQAVFVLMSDYLPPTPDNKQLLFLMLISMFLSSRRHFSVILSLLPFINVWHIYYIKNTLPIKPQSFDIYGTLARKYETKALFQVHLDCILDKIQDYYKNNNNKTSLDIFHI